MKECRNFGMCDAVKKFSGAVKHLLEMFVVAGIALLMFSNVAIADVIYEPEDKFYSDHESECQSCERYYVTNGYEGKVIIYTSPKKNKSVAEYENGKTIYVCYTYTDKNDITWGLLDTMGWFPLDYAYPVYDSVSFNDEYYDEFVDVPYNEEEASLVSGDTFYLYDYPGAADDGYLFTCDDWVPDTDTRYTDPFGYEWGYVSYYYGGSGWICLSHPDYTFEQLYPDGQSFSGVTEVPEECNVEIIPGKKTSNSDDDEMHYEDNDLVSSWWIVVIIAVVVLISVCAAVIIIVIIKRNKVKKQ